MSRIHINGQGHEVTVEHDGAELAYVVEKAQKLWQDTREQDKPYAAYGFTNEREGRTDRYRWGLGAQGGPAHIKSEATP